MLPNSTSRTIIQVHKSPHPQASSLLTESGFKISPPLTLSPRLLLPTWAYIAYLHNLTPHASLYYHPNSCSVIINSLSLLTNHSTLMQKFILSLWLQHYILSLSLYSGATPPLTLVLCNPFTLLLAQGLCTHHLLGLCTHHLLLGLDTRYYLEGLCTSYPILSLDYVPFFTLLLGLYTHCLSIGTSCHYSVIWLHDLVFLSGNPLSYNIDISVNCPNSCPWTFKLQTMSL